jgi:hypothetical protein
VTTAAQVRRYAWDHTTATPLVTFTASGSDVVVQGTNGHRDVAWTASSTGAITRTARYDPWGGILATTGSTFPDLRFQGAWHDTDTDLAWVVTRWYAPTTTLGRSSAGFSGSRSERERLDMSRSHGSEVTLVERGDLGLAEALRKGDHAGIDDPQGEIVVAHLQLAATGEVDRDGGLHTVDPRKHIIEEHVPCRAGKATGAPVVQLGQDQGRDDQVLVGVQEQARARLMVGIGRIERGQ